MVLPGSTALGRLHMNITKNRSPNREPWGSQSKFPTRMKMHRQLTLFASYLVKNFHSIEENTQKPQSCKTFFNKTDWDTIKSIRKIQKGNVGVQGLRSGESTRLPWRKEKKPCQEISICLSSLIHIDKHLCERTNFSLLVLLSKTYLFFFNIGWEYSTKLWAT